MLGHNAELSAFKSCDPAGAAQPDELPAGRSLCIWQAALGKPGGELARGAHSVIDHGGVDVQATDLIRISRPPVPHLFDSQHRAALFGGYALAQLFVPARDVKMWSCSHNVRSIRQERPARSTVMGTW
jgi:hypothetical protein